MVNFKNSESWLKRAESVIPLGSQTFSKSRTQYPIGISPLYASKAKGAHLWDVDGNKYIDYVSALACVTLGYGDKGIEGAIKRQLKKGISMSLPGKLETEVAEKLVEMIPSAEMVRFGKNGSDATSAAIRLARAYTGRDHVLVCGYHGWQDWFIASTTRDKGIPKSVGEMTHKFSFNDFDSLEKLIGKYPNQVAAVILEPMNIAWPTNDFLIKVREICTRSGIVLIFDETITGFRFANGGAQELFGVKPDLSTFGKGMANGMPISAVVGKTEIMKEMENIFFSGTFGGELLSLAAANEVLNRFKQIDIPKLLLESGENLNSQFENLISSFKLENIITLTGHPSWKFLSWKPSHGYSAEEIKTYFTQLIYEKGILLLNSHNMTLSHNKKIINSTVSIYSETIESLSKALSQGTLKDRLKVVPLDPLFRVR